MAVMLIKILQRAEGTRDQVRSDQIGKGRGRGGVGNPNGAGGEAGPSFGAFVGCFVPSDSGVSGDPINAAEGVSEEAVAKGARAVREGDGGGRLPGAGDVGDGEHAVGEGSDR